MTKTDRASVWSVTINNPIQADEENIALARQRGWKVEGQLERGENGTPHYQLMLKTPQVRFSAVKKQFPRAHIEVARNTAALSQYVVKEETREAQLTTDQTQYPSQQQIWQWFGSYNYSQEDLTRDYRVYTEQTFEQSNRLTKHQYLQQKLLDIFDTMIRAKIEEGYYCELIGVNPQIRSSVKNYGMSIMRREQLRRQKTDRQTDEISVSVPIITQNANDEEEVSSTCSSSESDTPSPSYRATLIS